MSTWIITGAASGLGRRLAAEALDNGHNVVLADRDTTGAEALVARYPDTAIAVTVDVTDPARRAAAVAAATERFGAVDVLVNNAGIDYIGAIEEQDEADYRRVFEVNFFGAVGMTRAVLPAMRAARSGLIANVTSMDGIASLPVNAFYSASKFALEGLTDALAGEVAHLGIRTLLVEPGSIRTGIEKNTGVSGIRIADYDAVTAPFLGAVASPTAGVDLFPGDPVRTAALMYAEITAAEPRRRLILGSDALANVTAAIARLRDDIEASADVAPQADFAS